MTMPIFRLGRAFALACLLAGCATKVPVVVSVPGMPNPELAMQESFARVDEEMRLLRGYQPGEKGPVGSLGPLPKVVPAELDRVVSFAWNGSLHDAVEKLGRTIGYRVSVERPWNAADVPIVLSGEPRRVYDLLEEMGRAAGSRATVRLDPQHQLVEVVYHVEA